MDVHARDDVQALVVRLVVDEVVRHVGAPSRLRVDPPAKQITHTFRQRSAPAPAT